MERRDAFISYVEEDAAFARALGSELRLLGQSTWTYEDDGIPGVSYLAQVHGAIAACSVFILVASHRSVRAHQVIREVEQAHEREKVIIPVRVGITHADFSSASPVLRMASGTAVSLASDATDIAKIARRIQATIQFAAEPQPLASATSRTASPPTINDAGGVQPNRDAGFFHHKPEIPIQPRVYDLRKSPRAVLRPMAWVVLIVGIVAQLSLSIGFIVATAEMSRWLNRAAGFGSLASGLVGLSAGVAVVLTLFGKQPRLRTTAAVLSVTGLCVALTESLLVIQFAEYSQDVAVPYAGGGAACLVVWRLARRLKPTESPLRSNVSLQK